MAFDSAFRATLGEHILNGVTYTPPSQWYLGLFWEDAGHNYLELSGGGYARVPVDLSLNYSPGCGMDTVQRVFPVATADWPQVMGISLFEAGTGGRPCFWYFISAPGTNPFDRRTVLAGQQLKFGVGALRYIGFRDVGTVWLGMTDSYRQKMYDWLFKGGTAVPAGGVQVLLATNTRTEFATANGYIRKAVPAWVDWEVVFSGVDPTGNFMPTTSLVWNVTGAWSPNLAPYHVGIHNGVEVMSWGSSGLGSSVMIAGDSITYAPNYGFGFDRLAVSF